MKNKAILFYLKKYAYLFFALFYLLACLLPVVRVSTGEQFSIYELPFTNILQVLIYPICIFLILIAGFFLESVREGRPIFISVISVANLFFLVLMPITLRKQIQLGWPGYWIVADAIKMLFGYYLLYCLTIACLLVFLIMWRMRAQNKAGKNDDIDG